MPPSLDSAWAKLDRASGHLDGLRNDIRAFLDGDPKPIVDDVHREGTHQVVRIRVNQALPETAWALQIGDCVHNARAALDHVAWQLAELWPAGHPSSDRDTMFPVCDSAQQFQGLQTRRLRYIEPPAQTVMESVQPYKGRHPQSESLGLLHALDITDKHRLLVAAAWIPDRAEVGCTDPISGFPDLTVRVRFNQELEWLEDGAEIATVLDPDVGVECNFTYWVAFRDGPAASGEITETLRALIEDTRAVVRLFEPFF